MSKRALPLSLLLHGLLLVGLYCAGILDTEAPPKRIEYVEVKFPEKPIELPSLTDNGVAAAAAPVAKTVEKPAASGLARLLKQSSSARSNPVHARTAAQNLTNTTHALQHLAKQGLPVVDKSSIQGIRGMLAKAQSEKLQSKFHWDALEDISESGSESPTDTSAIVAALAKYQREFRECYEQALFVDSSLTGKAQFLIAISESGSVSASKVNLRLTRAQSQAAPNLQNCLEAVGRKVHFPSTVGQKSVQFGLLLRS